MFKRSYRKNIGLMAGVEFFAFLGITSFWILFLSQIFDNPQHPRLKDFLDKVLNV